MKKFIISYDLVGLHRSTDYQHIQNFLSSAGAERILINLWLYNGYFYETAEGIKNTLIRYVIKNDRLVVMESLNGATYIGTPMTSPRHASLFGS
ncbi:hypothetical protein [uncultured Nostoc sp.]|uniref:hypothetical protein n=1 Tax=uncultured Nostoc sp. TaxID=340711 RepID=UPI002636F79B|nr:hypothetical protein [uncultured Nostoc sp.]